jgi:hypothetical protein
MLKTIKNTDMKKAMKLLLVSGLFLALPLMFKGQPPSPPHPNGGDNPGSGNSTVGGAAPIDGGLTFLLLLGAAYGSRKIYRIKK